MKGSKSRQPSLYPELDQPEIPPGVKGLPITDGRVCLPYQMYTDARISDLGRKAAAYIDSLLGREGYAIWQTVAKLAKDSGMPLRSFQKGLEELIGAAYLHSARQEFRGKRRRMLFALWKIPETLPLLDAERPDPGTGDRAQSGAKKRAQLGAKERAQLCASNGEERAQLCASNASERADMGAVTAQDQAHPYPISNTVLSSKEREEEDLPLTPPENTPVDPETRGRAERLLQTWQHLGTRFELEGGNVKFRPNPGSADWSLPTEERDLAELRALKPAIVEILSGVKPDAPGASQGAKPTRPPSSRPAFERACRQHVKDLAGPDPERAADSLFALLAARWEVRGERSASLWPKRFRSLGRTEAGPVDLVELILSTDRLAATPENYFARSLPKLVGAKKQPPPGLLDHGPAAAGTEFGPTTSLS